MRIAIIFGLNAPEDGNGLRDFGTTISQCRDCEIDYYEWNKLDVHNVYDVLIGHSLGGEAAIKYSNVGCPWKHKLFLINPVKGLWPLFLPIVFFPFKLNNPLVEATAFYAGICPPPSRITPGKCIDFKGYGHSSLCRSPEVWNTILENI